MSTLAEATKTADNITPHATQGLHDLLRRVEGEYREMNYKAHAGNSNPG